MSVTVFNEMSSDIHSEIARNIAMFIDLEEKRLLYRTLDRRVVSCIIFWLIRQGYGYNAKDVCRSWREMFFDVCYRNSVEDSTLPFNIGSLDNASKYVHKVRLLTYKMSFISKNSSMTNWFLRMRYPVYDYTATIRANKTKELKSLAQYTSIPQISLTTIFGYRRCNDEMLRLCRVMNIIKDVNPRSIFQCIVVYNEEVLLYLVKNYFHIVNNQAVIYHIAMNDVMTATKKYSVMQVLYIAKVSFYSSFLEEYYGKVKKRLKNGFPGIWQDFSRRYGIRR